MAALAFDSKRYVGAQIGIHDPAGRKVGTVGRTRNLEYVVVAGPRTTVERMVAPFADATALLANGSYTRFADGTQMCWKNDFVAAGTSGGVWTFPAPFVDATAAVTATARGSAPPPPRA